jgi:hypothetical protein
MLDTEERELGGETEGDAGLHVETQARPHSAKLAVRSATCQTKQVTQQSACQWTAHRIYLLPASTAACLTGKAG